MRELIAGHKYLLDNLKSEGETVLNFYMDPELHTRGQEGTSCQEVIRALIARVKTLHEEKPHPVNPTIIQNLRECLFHFEMRALAKKVAEGFEIENIPISPDGHLALTLSTERESALLDALDAAHYYIDADAMEIKEDGIKDRDMVLFAAREFREQVDPVLVREPRLYQIGGKIAAHLKGT